MNHRSLPIRAVFMAGGQGRRLLPLTTDVPKPLLPVGGSPLLFHNISRVLAQGISEICISLHHQAERIKTAVQENFPEKNIQFIEENSPLGTIGALGCLEMSENPFVLLLNADILSTLDFGNFYTYFQDSEADLLVAVVPYPVSIPYGIIQENGGNVVGIEEKPSFSYSINTGIYLFKQELTSLIPDGQYLDATEWANRLIELGYKVKTYQMVEYWLDIGSKDDYERAQRDFHRLSF